MRRPTLLQPVRPSRTAIISPPTSQLNLARTGEVGDEQFLTPGTRRTIHDIAAIGSPRRVFVVAGTLRQLARVAAVHLHGEQVELAVRPGDVGDAVTLG